MLQDLDLVQVRCEAVRDHVVGRDVHERNLLGRDLLAHVEVPEGNVVCPLAVDGILGDLDARLVVLIHDCWPLWKTHLG